MSDARRFSRFARLYDAVMPATDAEPLERALSHADRVERVLDVGGGTGRAARALGVDAVVVDAAPGMARRAHHRGQAAVIGDAARLPVRDASVDAVVVLDALHHFPDRRGAIEEAARVLRPGGVLVVRDFDRGTLRGRALALSERLVGFDSSFATGRELAEAMRAAGLSPVVVEAGWVPTVVGKR